MRTAANIILIVAVALVIVALACTESIPLKSLTKTRMTITEQRIRKYFVTHHKLPAKLSDLLPMPMNRDGSVADGWGRPIEYIVNGMSVVLLSLGKDAQSGGTGHDSDIRVIVTVGDAISSPP